MKTTRLLVFLFTLLYLTLTLGCNNEPTREVDTTKMAPQEQQMRKEKAGE